MNDATGADWLSFGALAGAVAGSFLSTLVLRWGQGRTIAGRSACDACSAALDIADLVPVFSWIFVRGRCRKCHATIPRDHIVGEAGCAILGAACLAALPDMRGIEAALSCWLLFALAVLDARWFWLPHRLTGALAILGVVFGAMGASPPLLDRLIGGAIGWGSLALIALVYRRVRGRDGLGGGDATLLGAVGLWLGWAALPFVLLGASAAGLLTILAMKLRGRNIASDTRLPLGAMIAVAAITMWFVTV